MCGFKAQLVEQFALVFAKVTRSKPVEALNEGATLRFVHLEKFSHNFSSWSYAIRVNLFHP